MENRFIMTAFGKDRPGIVADVTEILYENGCNLEDTAMTRLADEFTLVLLFESRVQAVEEILIRECRKLEEQKEITASVREIGKRVALKEDGFQTVALHVEGVDQSGIVHRISRFLAEKRVNICDLRSGAMEVPESGAKHYLMNMQLQVPEAISVEELEEGLCAVADELNVDINLSKG